VWAQGVTFTPGFDQFFELLFFTGPGLCPSCLAKGHGTFTTTSLAEVRVNWLAEDPPIAGILWTENSFKGGPLGPRPFSDIPLDTQQVTTQAFTSAFMDHWDPTYQWLVEKAKGVGCFPFQYDPGIVQPFPPVVTGNLQMAYIGLDPVDGVLPVYTDANCVTPFVFDVFGELVPSFLRMGSTGDDGGFAMDWFSEFDFGASGEKGSVEKNHRHAPGYDESCEACDDEDDDDDDRATKGEGTIYVYGVTPTLTVEFDGMVAIVPSLEAAIGPPTVEEILDDPAEDATMSMTIP
jgi:hypothetical protein